MKQQIIQQPASPAAGMERTLDHVAPGSNCRIARVNIKGPVRRRLMDMGMVSGAEVHVVRVAPLGDPMELKIKGYLLSVRKEDAQFILVESIA